MSSSRRSSFSASVKDLKRRFSRRKSEDVTPTPVTTETKRRRSHVFDAPPPMFDDNAMDVAYVEAINPAYTTTPTPTPPQPPISYEDLLKPVGNDIASYNYARPDTSYSTIDVSANDAIYAEETQPVVRIKTGNIYDDPDYLKQVTKSTEFSLKPLLTSDNQLVNVNYVFIAQAPQLPHNTDLFTKQHIINSYLQRVLNLNMTLFQLLHNTPGISAPLYKAYVLILMRSMPNADVKFLHKINEAMYSLYTRWADQVPAMIELVLNTNGENVIKEIMTVINQSVYRILYMVLRANNVANIDTVRVFADLPFRQVSDADFIDDQERNTINNQQRIITNSLVDKFNNAVFQHTFNRYYLLPTKTPDIDVPYVAQITTQTLHMEMIRLFRLQRTPADLFDNPAYVRSSNTVYVDTTLNESEA
ncbi:ORF136 [Spodoptera frugiperda granulovirus]|uniref:ORF136 n=1 Tax=Spodoptera frugiperda granulovirus TaxID=307454 RepID=A0A0C5ASI7_9BBAC|nr:ORF136 [Spodoptera frugiperda granulovirus]AJK91797.1 ORF136 [Spodoptera frugiperda granulovirus]